MSVIAAKRKESDIEALTFAEGELYDKVVDLMQRNFGVRDIDHFVRVRYAYGLDSAEDFGKYRYLLYNAKSEISRALSMVSNNLRISNSIYLNPKTTEHERQERRSYQNLAIGYCDVIRKELQQTVKIFEVDVNVYAPAIKAINREIELIKKWRQKDNKVVLAHK